MMLARVFEELDVWIDEQNKEAGRTGLRELRRCEFLVVGQSALMEADLEFEIVGTDDLDAFTNAEHAVLKQLEEILATKGLKYDFLSSEIWMPEETEYKDIFRGDWVTSKMATVEYIMVSKAKKNMSKNKNLLREYLASTPSEKFFELCEKFEVELNLIVED